MFNLFWEKLVHILQQSFQKMKGNETYEYLLAVLSDNYPAILRVYDDTWSRLTEDLSQTHNIVLKEYSLMFLPL